MERAYESFAELSDQGGGYSSPVGTPDMPQPATYMLNTSDNTAVTAQPYSVESFNAPADSLGLEAMPASLIDSPITYSKKMMIAVVVVVVIVIGYFIYKKSKKNKKF
nr:hypothetical protein [Pedobacter sp. ASV2]